MNKETLLKLNEIVENGKPTAERAMDICEELETANKSEVKLKYTGVEHGPDLRSTIATMKLITCVIKRLTKEYVQKIDIEDEDLYIISTDRVSSKMSEISAASKALSVMTDHLTTYGANRYTVDDYDFIMNDYCDGDDWEKAIFMVFGISSTEGPLIDKGIDVKAKMKEARDDTEKAMRNLGAIIANPDFSVSVNVADTVRVYAQAIAMMDSYINYDDE